MAVDLPTFIANFPEFTAAATSTPVMVQSALDAAYLMTPIGIWTALQDEGAQLRAAQWIAMSPYGSGLELSRSDGSTLYDSRLNRLIAIVAAGGSHT